MCKRNVVEHVVKNKEKATVVLLSMRINKCAHDITFFPYNQYTQFTNGLFLFLNERVFEIGTSESGVKTSAGEVAQHTITKCLFTERVTKLVMFFNMK